MKALVVTILLIAVGVTTLAACNSVSATYPAVGQVVYCPSCDRNLYERVSGTSRTAFRRAEYVPLYFDIDIPQPGAESLCPFCKHTIAQFDAHGYVERVYYRDKR